MARADATNSWWREGGLWLLNLIDRLEPMLTEEAIAEVIEEVGFDEVGQGAWLLAEHLHINGSIRLPAGQVLMLRTLVRGDEWVIEDARPGWTWSALASDPDAFEAPARGVRCAFLRPCSQEPVGLLLGLAGRSRCVWYDLDQFELSRSLQFRLDAWLCSEFDRGQSRAAYRRQGYELARRLQAELQCEEVIYEPLYRVWERLARQHVRDRRWFAFSGLEARA